MAHNVLNRYLFEDLSVRGELVQLDDCYQQIIADKGYPAAIEKLLGELLVATTLLTATLKFSGTITIQLQGDGPVSLAVINGDNEQKVRGVARWEGELDTNASLHDMLGKGSMIITIDPKEGERYQGIVALDGETLADVIESYFANSEQLKTRIWIRTGEYQGKANAAGMLIQVMPDGTGSENDFEHLEQLTDTVKDEELFSLPANELLYRLYNQEKVRIYTPQPVEFHCGCSRERSASAILTLDRAEVQDILQTEGHITLHCDYCGTDYSFNPNEISDLYTALDQQNKTLH